VDEKAAIDVMRHLDRALRTHGLDHLAVRLTASDLPDDPRSRLLRYLDVLEVELEAARDGPPIASYSACAR
jgi:hypothetical protein